MKYLEIEECGGNKNELEETPSKRQIYQWIEAGDFEDFTRNDLPYSPKEAAGAWLARLIGEERERNWRLEVFSGDSRGIKRAFVSGISNEEFTNEPFFSRVLRTEVLEKLPCERIVNRAIGNSSDRPNLSRLSMDEEIHYREASLATILYLISAARGKNGVQEKIHSFLGDIYEKNSEELSLLEKDCGLSRGLGALGRDLAWVYYSCGADYFKGAFSGLSRYSSEVKQAVDFLEKGKAVAGDPFYWFGNLIRKGELSAVADRVFADQELKESVKASIIDKHLANRYLLSRMKGIIKKGERLGIKTKDYSDYDKRYLKTIAGLLIGKALSKENLELAVDVIDCLLENEGYFGKYLDSGERNILEEDPLNLFSSCAAAAELILEKTGSKQRWVKQAERLLCVLKAAADKFEDAFWVETPSKFIIDLLKMLNDKYPNLSAEGKYGIAVRTTDVSITVFSTYLNSWFRPQNRDELEKIFGIEEGESIYPQFKTPADIVRVIASLAEGINKENLPEFVRKVYIDFYKQVVSYLSEVMVPAERKTREGVEIISLQEQIKYYQILPVSIHMAVLIDRVDAELRRIINPTKNSLFKPAERSNLSLDTEFQTAVKIMTLIKTKLLRPEDRVHTQLALDHFQAKSMMVQPSRVAGETELLTARAMQEKTSMLAEATSIPKEYIRLLEQLTEAIDHPNLTDEQRERIIALFEESWEEINRRVELS